MRRTVIVAALALSCGLAATAAGTAKVAKPRWVPPQQLTWYWQLQGPPKVQPVQASDFDAFDTNAATVTRFHRLGQHLICYVDAGTWERWRPDAGRFPASVLGRPDGWPGERWLDIRRRSVVEPIMRARFDMCARKGFDALEPDNIDAFENHSGFAITAGQQLRYDRWIAETVHGLGMAVFQKNDPEQASQLEPDFDGVLDEQCNQYSECSSFAAYRSAGKPILNAEYQAGSYSRFCAADRRARIMGALYGLVLDGRRYRPCWTKETR